jgi:hypothetical protein
MSGASVEPQPWMGGSTHADAVQIDITFRMYVQAAHREGFAVSPDLRVSEKDAATLLGYSPGYLKTMRQEGRAPVSYLRGWNGCRISYRLLDIARWVESARDSR